MTDLEQLCPECGSTAARCAGFRARARPGKCCPDCRHYLTAEPPGQLELLPRPLPGTTAKSWRIVTACSWSKPERDLTMAALRAAAAAESYGESWLVAPDHSFARVAQDGAVHPYTGWAVPAARAITMRSKP